MLLLLGGPHRPAIVAFGRPPVIIAASTSGPRITQATDIASTVVVADSRAPRITQAD